MTITNTNVKVVALANGVQTVFNYDFLVPAKSQADLLLVDGDGNQVTLNPATWSLQSAGSPTGGTFTYPLSGTALAVPNKLVLIRRVPAQQTTVLGNQGPFFQQTVEQTFDTEMEVIQQLSENVSRAFQFPAGEQLLGTVPGTEARKGMVLGFDTIDGSLTLFASAGGSQGPAAVPAGITGDVQINGGTVLAAVAIGSLGQVLTNNGPGVAPTWQTSAAGGDVGPGTLNQIAYYVASGTTIEGSSNLALFNGGTLLVGQSGTTSQGAITLQGDTGGFLAADGPLAVGSTGTGDAVSISSRTGQIDIFVNNGTVNPVGPRVHFVPGSGLLIYGGNGYAGSVNGGGLDLIAGTGSGAGYGGAISITAGDDGASGGFGGDIQVLTGSSTTGIGGDFGVTAGNGATGGASVSFTTGNATSNGSGGNFNVTLGTRTGVLNNNGQFVVINLPAGDPSVANAFWNKSGVIVVGSTQPIFLPTSVTSGGAIIANSNSTVASTTLLAANQLILGAGAGVGLKASGTLGTTTTVLHGNAAGAPTFAAVSLTADVSGQLPLANIANIGTSTVLGNVGTASAAPSALTTTQLTTLVNAFTTSLSGAAPASGGGTANYLRADGTWAAPPGTTGTVTSVAATAGGLFSFTGSPITTAGTLTLAVTGTLSAVPYFSNTGTLSSGPALTGNAIMLGNSTGPKTVSGLNTNGNSKIILGFNGGSIGSMDIVGNTSGTITVTGVSAAGTYNFVLPTTAGSAGQALLSGGGGSTAMTWTSGTLALGGNLNTAAAFTQAGSFATTITSTATSNATLPAGTNTLAVRPVITLYTTGTGTHTYGATTVTVSEGIGGGGGGGGGGASNPAAGTGSGGGGGGGGAFVTYGPIAKSTLPATATYTVGAAGAAGAAAGAGGDGGSSTMAHSGLRTVTARGGGGGGAGSTSNAGGGGGAGWTSAGAAGTTTGGAGGNVGGGNGATTGNGTLAALSGAGGGGGGGTGASGAAGNGGGAALAGPGGGAGGGLNASTPQAGGSGGGGGWVGVVGGVGGGAGGATGTAGTSDVLAPGAVPGVGGGGGGGGTTTGGAGASTLNYCAGGGGGGAGGTTGGVGGAGGSGYIIVYEWG